MAAKSLRCRECEAEYELEAKYVCERCFGPLEVSYERPEILDVDGLRRRIQAGPQNIWRYADFLPLRRLPARRPAWRRARACPPAARRSSAPTASPSASACARCGSRTTRRTPRTPSRTAS